MSGILTEALLPSHTPLLHLLLPLQVPANCNHDCKSRCVKIKPHSRLRWDKCGMMAPGDSTAITLQWQ